MSGCKGRGGQGGNLKITGKLLPEKNRRKYAWKAILSVILGILMVYTKLKAT